MKIRTDYVTNSSSSSFILGFKSEDDIAKVLADDYCGGYFETIYKDCKEAEKMNMDEMLATAGEEMEWNVRFDIEYESEISRKMSWDKRHEWTKTKEFEDMVEKEIHRRLDEIKSKAEKNSNQIFVDVSYADECGDGELEHDIVPYLDCCLRRFSHH